MRRLVSIFAFVVVFLIANGFIAFAQPAPSSRASKAAVAAGQMEQAMSSIKQEFGPTVLSDRRGEVEGRQHGRETIGQAWDRHLTSAGFPESMADREHLARDLQLSAGSALLLVAGAADEDKINHLLHELRRISTSQ